MRPSAVVMLCLLAGSAGQETYSPARYATGPVPAIPAMSVGGVGGGEVVLELEVNREGRVAAIKPLRTTPPFGAMVTETVGQWQFAAARELVRRPPPDEGLVRVAVESKVLVAAVFRRPALLAPTLGEPPTTVAGPSIDVPFPVAIAEPPHPPTALAAGVVLVEVQIDRDGMVSDATVVGSAPPFDDAARTAARSWRFRPARMGGQPVESVAYILFGFPVPITD